jgi:hypothetical protein
MNNGSFMVFRRLNQLVPEFDDFILSSAGALGVDPVLLGARLVGRWKSGAPLALTPSQDDVTLGADPKQNNISTILTTKLNVDARTLRIFAKQTLVQTLTKEAFRRRRRRCSPHYSCWYSIWAGGEPGRASGQHHLPRTGTDIRLLSKIHSQSI